MPSLNIPAKQIKGILPAMDRRSLQQPSVVSGQNFLVDLKGPYAAFTNRIFMYNRWFNPQYVQSFRDDTGDTFYMTLGAVFRFDVVSQRLILLFTFADSGTIYRWTRAVINGVYYFARAGINGVISYNPSTQAWTLLTANIPANPIAVCAGSGRLVVMSATFVAWSALGDGTNMAPDLTSGAGFQPLSLVGGTGIIPVETADGFMSFTSKGVMKSEFAYALNTFRHYVLDRTFVPINSFCIEPLSSGLEYVILDSKGFFSGAGKAFIEFEPLMGEYFSKTLLPTLDLTNPQMIRLEYSEPNKQLFVSIASALLDGTYSYAYVLYRPVSEWGIFNYSHYNLMEMSALSGVLKGYHFGFIGSDGLFRYFVGDVFAEGSPTNSLIYYNRLDADTPIRIVNGTLIATADLHIHNEDESLFALVGMYQFNGNNPPIVYTPVDNPVNSFVEIGLLRWSEQKYDDEIGTVTNIKLSVDDFPGGQIFTDYNNVPIAISIDYNNLPMEVDEDWGSGTLSSAIFTSYIIGTNDGFTVWEDQQEQLTLSVDSGDDKYYVCFNSGVYHTVRLEALLANTTFHLRLMELSGSVSGRI